ncbi:hypothetical protein EDD17DRAFT_1475305 [Pisolithus thermaeus]|nr:hypothetical protein EV401DRAFT_1881302 [Pisolithus croceorrhizus]KAI6163994.1 hypothetical protein EDD17DRAFT_1475305 [Pisolithus thermaeus]
MPWPEFITYQFELVNKLKANESHYYGPFNALFQHLFPPSRYYQVIPQLQWGAEHVNSTIFFVIRWQKVPVLYVMFKPYTSYDLCLLCHW